MPHSVSQSLKNYITLVILVYKICIGSSHNPAHNHTFRVIGIRTNGFILVATDCSSGVHRWLHGMTSERIQVQESETGMWGHTLQLLL